MSEDVSIISGNTNDPLFELGATITVQPYSFETINNNVGYYFDIITEHAISVQNQITDNFLENNTAVQDHIAHNPITVSLSGLSAEVFYESPNWALNKAYNKYNTFVQEKFGNTKANEYLLSDKLLAIPQLVPGVDNVTQIAKNAVQYVESSYRRYEKIVKNFINKNIKETRLRQIYRELKELSDTNTALIVETPFIALDNMYIQSISLRQGNENYITDLSVTLKQIQYADVSITEPDKNVMAKYNQFARAELENNGKAQGKSVSLAKSFFNKVGITQAGSGVKR